MTTIIQHRIGQLGYPNIYVWVPHGYEIRTIDILRFVDGGGAAAIQRYSGRMTTAEAVI